MKSAHIFTVIISVFVSTITYSNEPVKFILSGNANVNYSSSEDSDDSFGYGILPQFGLMFANRFEVGIGGGYSYDNGSVRQFDQYGNYIYFDTQERTKTLNLYAKDNFFRNERLSVFYGVYFNRNAGSKEYDAQSNISDYNTKSFDIGLNTGINYSLSNKIELTTSIGALSYSKFSVTQNNGGTNTYKDIDFLIDFGSIYWGIRFIL